jgi:D-alanyl-D-alanine dipeptidase
VAEVALAVGAEVVPVTAAEHDDAVAAISHVPHLLAAALAAAAGEAGPLALALAAGSFRDGTRVIGSDPAFVTAMVEGNAAPTAAALARVQARLRKEGLGLKVFDGYRPRRATLAMVEWAYRTGHNAYVDSGYVARRSRHNLGVAVDLTLVDLKTGAELPMGTPFDTFSPAAHTANAQGQVRHNRRTLVRAMEAEGFTNYEQEWWHFSYPVEGAVPFDKVIR